MRKNIYAFKEELESYNKLLSKHLAVKDDRFIFDSEYNDYEDTNHAEEGCYYDLEAASKKLNFNMESVKIIPIFEYKDTGYPL